MSLPEHTIRARRFMPLDSDSLRFAFLSYQGLVVSHGQ
jgi:hypothetical protein